MRHTRDFIVQVDKLREIIERDQEQLIDLLLQYETYATAKDEIKRSLATLCGLEKELSKTKSTKKVSTVSTFFPINLPLYSFILFAVVPSYFANTVYVRVSNHIGPVLTRLSVALGMKELFPQVQLKSYERKKFSRECVKNSDVILFCGRYENALAIRKENPEALFIYNGSGINPAVVTRNADVDVAVEKIVEMRTFNSGQDCAGTDCIFVERSVYDMVVRKLRVRLAELNVGQYGDTSIDIGPVVRSDYVKHLKTFLDDNRDYIVHEGVIKENLVSPFIIQKDIREHTGEFVELFAPVFYIVTYDNLSEVADILERHKESSMYISLFSQQNIEALQFKRFAKIAQVLRNKIVNDVEQGNMAYGGYGAKANFVAHGSETKVYPVLISREIDKYIVGGFELKSDRISVTMLGSGCWEGTPAPFCRCKLCRIASKNILSIENRMRPSFYIKSKKSQFVMELGPDFRMQTAKFNLPKVRDFLVSHWHNDHLFGVFDLHFYAELVLKDKINIYCSEGVAQYMREHINYMPINVVAIKPFDSFYLGDVKVTPFPVCHMYSHDKMKDADDFNNNVFGFLLEHRQTRIAYLADYYAVPEKSLKLVEGVDAAIADGTYLFEEIWPDKDLQNLTREEKDPDHLHGEEIMRFVSDLHAKKVVYHSISHLPGLTHNKLQEQLPKGQFIGFDGMDIV